MRASQFHIATTRETPNDADIVSHQLMLRAGLVRRMGSGLYNWLPIGLRTLRKVEAIVREEMDRAGAMELLLPVIQPAELWQESGRWDKYGLLLLKGRDRHDRDFCVGPTHEEVITDLMRHEIRSYRQLPINTYQIQIKFRDEIRPRFGVMRAREFIMKDAYSFDIDEAGMQVSFDRMHDAYCAIFDRLGLEYRAVEADSGEIGGARSREFHVLADTGEDAIAYATEGSYAANVEKAVVVSSAERASATAALASVDTPGVHTIAELCASLDVAAERCAKTLLVKGAEVPVVALVVRGDHQLNEIKASKLPEVFEPLTFADPDTIHSVAGCDAGSIGPVGLSIPVIADADAAAMNDFVAGANENDRHVTGVNWGRDLPEPLVHDLRDAQEGDQAPDGQGVYKIVRGIEVGHIFQLGTTYSEQMQANVLDEGGRPQPLQMGCYGIGVTRVVAAAIEQGNDEKGIIWPDSIAPFKAVISPIHMQKSDAVREAAESLYQTLLAAGIDVLFDDRPLRPGVMFADMELLGIPHRFVVSDKLLAEGMVEYKGRRDSEARVVAMNEVLAVLAG